MEWIIYCTVIFLLWGQIYLMRWLRSSGFSTQHNCARRKLVPRVTILFHANSSVYFARSRTRKAQNISTIKHKTHNKPFGPGSAEESKGYQVKMLPEIFATTEINRLQLIWKSKSSLLTVSSAEKSVPDCEVRSIDSQRESFFDSESRCLQ